MISAAEALRRLQEGNRRFVAGQQELSTGVDESKRRELVEGQAPFAIILGCSDSRVPAELVFDQGLGDLFVIRVAGNVVAPSQIGSIEFAAECFGTPLVVVLGHSNCGAIQATLSELERPQENRSPNLRSIVDRIRPSVEPLLESVSEEDAKTLAARAGRANIRASANQLRHGSQILEQLVGKGELLIVGAEYSLESGKVDFFEGMPDGSAG
ncbi:carbonic anhydrase [Microbulbifer taiwanensis]|uniref:carbonic anhydrase n=1 Tax=Microbulbifer taiwanensis TaxID=986746 RepID=A0ABW1YPQ3_9GAMM|nr:carbonic anhydrase [Microbulbifer taiwanensis]